MLICHCRRVNDRTIRQAVSEGASTCDEVGDACGAGTGCGGCKPAITGLIVTERASEGVAALPMIILAPEQGV